MAILAFQRGASDRCQASHGMTRHLGSGEAWPTSCACPGAHSGHVAQVARSRGEPDEIEGGRLRRGDPHRAGLRLNLGDRRGFDYPAHMKRNPHAAGACRSGQPVGDNLEDHRLLVSRAVNRRGTQQPDVVRLLQIAHQVVDEPARGGAACLALNPTWWSSPP